MAVVWIPSLLRDLTGGQGQVEVAGKTVREVIEALDDAYPGLKARLCDGDRLDPTISVSVDGKIAPLRLLAPVGEESEVHFLPAVAGG
jgi:molybdopterin synthase sulfur carrier subunit